MQKQSRLLNKWQLCQYLRKLQLPQELLEPNLATLKILQEAHLKYIPYENLDLLVGQLTSLKREVMFEKIIMKNRGGICFELNGLYNWLLESLGFTVKSYAARFIDRLDEIQMRRHRVMCVTIENKRYLTDVGVNSESTRQPLEMIDGLVQSDGISEYKFSNDPFWGWVLWQKEKRKPWKRMFGFTEELQLDMDFIPASIYTDFHPASTLNKTKAISVFREDCNITIRGNLLKFYLGGKVKYRYNILTEAELKSILWEYFGIAIDYRLPNGGIDIERE